MPSTDYRFKTAKGDIHQHMINNYDWDENYLLYTYLDLPGCDDTLFLQFLEQTVHPIVLSDEEVLEETINTFNSLLGADGYTMQRSGAISGKPIYKAVNVLSESTDGAMNKYEVVLSYASEDRSYVESVATCLKSSGVRVFFDLFEEVNLWGKDLTEHLNSVYCGDARFCVMFISEHYAAKNWTRHEWRSAFSKAIADKNEYILPARFDDSHIPGLTATTVYVDLRKKTSDELCTMIISKLGRNY